MHALNVLLRPCMAGHVRLIARLGVLRARRCSHRRLHVLRREQGKAGRTAVDVLCSRLAKVKNSAFTETKLHWAGALNPVLLYT